MKGSARWILVGLLFLATLLNYLDRQTLSVSASKIAEDFGLNDAHLGRLFFAFFISYGVAQILIGGWLDRLRVKTAYAGAVAAWSLAGAAGALAGGFWSLFGLRALLGVCESPNWPLALRVTSRVFPPEQRSFANGLFQCGTSVGALVAAPLIIWLTTLYNWRFAFVVMGACGLLWVALWLGFFRLRPDSLIEHDQFPHHVPEGEAGRRADEAKAGDSPSTLAEILRSPALWGLLVATSLINPLQYFYVSWLPRYFDQYAGVGFGKELAQRLVLVYLAMDLGFVLGGALVAWLSRRMPVARARLRVVLGGVLCMAGVPFVARLTNVDAITALLCLATFGHGCFIVNYLAFTSEVSVKKVSTAAGILGGAGSLAGAAFMLLVGELVEANRSFNTVFALAGVMPLAALAGMWFSTKKETAT